jgi:hypothetical protein
MFGVRRQERHDDPEADEIDEHRQENNQDRRAPFHRKRANRHAAKMGRTQKGMAPVYLEPETSQARVGLGSGTFWWGEATDEPGSRGRSPHQLAKRTITSGSSSG